MPIASLQGDPDLLVAADQWADRALGSADDDDAYVAADLGITEALLGPVTPYHRRTGSLFKGPLGVATLLVDLEYPELAAMPVFGREGW